MDSQQGSTVESMELCSMLCGSLDGRGVWGRMDTWISMAESFRCSPELITTLLTGYTPTHNKKFKKRAAILATKEGNIGKWMQLVLEQYGFKTMWINLYKGFFSINATNDPQLVDSVVAEPQIQRVGQLWYLSICRFWCPLRDNYIFLYSDLGIVIEGIK